MLVPLRRETFQQIIPMVATGPQYAHYWGRVSDCLRRALISFVALLISWLLRVAGPMEIRGIAIIFICISLPLLVMGSSPLASLKNATYRRFPYSGFWQGKVLDVYITEEVVREEQTVNKLGELVIVENVEKRINLEIGDATGFTIKVKAPLRRIYKKIRPGQIAELLVISSKDDLSRIDCVSDVYLPQDNLWIGEYPYLRRDVFVEVSRKLSRRKPEATRRARYNG